MAAGDSARDEATRQLALAAEHEAAAAEARNTAARYDLASTTERRTATLLTPLAALGHHLLADRGWPGSRNAQVDMVVVGPGGVFIVDTKAWKDVTIVGDRIFRGDADVTDELESLADLGSASEEAFAEEGLAPGEVRTVIALAGRQGVEARLGAAWVLGEKDVARHILMRGARLTDAVVDRVLVRAVEFFPQVGAAAPVNAAVREPVAAAPEPLTEDDLPSEEEIAKALYAGIMAAPVEEWMTFLHPDQAKLVRRSFNGPARIRGPVGSGKTVIGLHRAAYLARTRPGRVLFTTYVRTLPEVMASLLTRLAPEVTGQVQFTGIYAFATRLLKERGVTFALSATKARAVFDAAWAHVGQPGALGRSSMSRKYWQDEIEYVIKGRGLTRFEEYADLTRTGRRYALNVDQRRAVWELYVAYTAGLRAGGICDFQDVVLMAEAELRRAPLDPPYSAVIVDEAQDLSCAMVRMLYALAGDAPDAFTLIGDGQQTIYPGGYTLGEAGVSVAGRGVVFEVNYRNTAEILAFAARLVEGSEFADIEGEMARGDALETVWRTGPEPVVERAASRAVHDARMVERVRAVVSEVGTGLGDVGVLCCTKAAVANATRALGKAGIPCVSLEDYDGTLFEGVKVGTIKRAKGLEFKQVLLPAVRARDLDDSEPPAGDAERERWELARRELYVGATRARDGLWVGVL